MTPPSPIAHVMGALLALGGPLLVAVSTFLVVDNYRDADERMADENAGFVFNGQVRLGGAVPAMDQVMRNTDPELVLLGPSYANTDIDPGIIAEHLKLREDEVAMLSVPNSVGSHWYAILKYRVFEAGYRPKAIVVVSGLQSMLLNTPLTESSWVNLRVQLDDPDDPEVAARARRDRSIAVGRFREQRAKVREATMGAMRDLPPLLLLPSRARPGKNMGPLETRHNLDKVFDDDNLDMRLHTGGHSPVVSTAMEEIRGYDPSMLPSPDQSFIPVITDLARQYGARVVWIRPPMSPDIPVELDDRVPDGYQEQTVEMLHRQGGHFVDMRGLPMSTDMFKNADHMNAEGSRRFSEAVGRALQGLDALQPEAIPGARPPLTPTSMRVLNQPGPEPVVEGLPEGGRWVGPGASLVIRFGEGWVPERGVFFTKVVVEQFTERPGALPDVVVDERPVSISWEEAGEEWRRGRGERATAAPTGPFEIRVMVPSDGEWTHVTALALGKRAGRSLILGDKVALDGAQARLFGVYELEQGALMDRSVHPTFANKPSAVPDGARKVIDVPRSQVGRYDTPKWGFLSDEFLMGQAHFGSRCSPLRISENGQVLPYPNVPCVEVHRDGEGRACHSPDALYFGSSDGTDPARNQRKYRMVLDPGRRCDGFVWLYPKDAFTVRWPQGSLQDFRRGATHFTFGARYLQKRPARIEVVLRVDGQERIRESIDGRTLWDGPRTWRLDPPISADAQTVELQVENLEHVFYLVEEAALSEGPLVVERLGAGGFMVGQ